MSNIDWAQVYRAIPARRRWRERALRCRSEELASAEVLDVRRAGMFEKADALIRRALARPRQVEAWARDVPRDKEIVVYCIYGHEVGRATALRLRLRA
jgi:Fe-Mn family superoxide dismutase